MNWVKSTSRLQAALPEFFGGSEAWMSRERSEVDTGSKQLSEDEFMAKYGPETEEGDAADQGEVNALAGLLGSVEIGESPIRSALPHLNRWWLVRQLRAAVKENSPEAYKLRLEYFLCRRLQAEPPECVLTPWPKRPGRPLKAQTRDMYFMWIDLSKPPLYKKTLAKAFFRKSSPRLCPPIERK